MKEIPEIIFEKESEPTRKKRKNNEWFTEVRQEFCVASCYTSPSALILLGILKHLWLMWCLSRTTHWALAIMMVEYVLCMQQLQYLIEQVKLCFTNYQTICLSNIEVFFSKCRICKCDFLNALLIKTQKR